ncbi:MAG: type II toxin-antitoxin system VapB family antitoxin [Solirubrobacteraceae bacterium]
MRFHDQCGSRDAEPQHRQITIPCETMWHTCGMNRIRLSTTVDASLLQSARGARPGVTDAAMIDEALQALLTRERSAEIDASYAAYDEHPLDQPDEWGDLASFREAAARS